MISIIFVLLLMFHGILKFLEKKEFSLKVVPRIHNFHQAKLLVKTKLNGPPFLITIVKEYQKFIYLKFLFRINVLSKKRFFCDFWVEQKMTFLKICLDLFQLIST